MKTTTNADKIQQKFSQIFQKKASKRSKPKSVL